MDLHPLKVFLQSQLASDSSAVLHLPNVIPALLPEHFDASPHLQKWIARLNSLIHGKDVGARWAGLTLATQTSVLSKPLMMENAQSWIGAALPLLSKSEATPIMKAVIRLLLHIFSAAIDIPEFQRQLATPNVPKFSSALVTLAEKHENYEVKLLALNTLAAVIPLYPTLHKALHGPLTGLCLRNLSGSAPKPTNLSLLEATSRVYATLPVTRGKVGAAALWRKSVDDTLTFAWAAFMAVRTAFPHDGRLHPPRNEQPSKEDPLLSIPFNVDRLRCATAILGDLLRISTTRPVQVPVGAMVKFCQALLSCTDEEKKEGHVDPSTRALEVAAVPELWRLGSQLLDDLAFCTRSHLSSSIPRFAAIIVFHLERRLTSSQRTHFLRAITSALTHSHVLHHPILPTRITKTLLSTLSILLPSQSEAQNDVGAASGSKTRKGKRKAREYEGGEVFKMTGDVMCPSLADGDMVIAALDVLRLLLRNPYVAPATHSLACRVLLSVNLSLPFLSPSQLSHDLHLHAQVLDIIQALCLEVGAGTPSAMSKSLGLVIHELRSQLDSRMDPRCSIDLLLHPRVPPLVRSLPHVETLSLFRAEESTEEKDVRERLHIGVVGPPAAQSLGNTESIAPTSLITPALSIAPMLTLQSGLTGRSDGAPAQGFNEPHPAPVQPQRVENASTTAPPPASIPKPSANLSGAEAPVPAATSSSSRTIASSPSALASSSSVDAGTATRVPETTPSFPIFVDDDDGDEEMPSIYMGSDSE